MIKLYNANSTGTQLVKMRKILLILTFKNTVLMSYILNGMAKLIMVKKIVKSMNPKLLLALMDMNMTVG